MPRRVEFFAGAIRRLVSSGANFITYIANAVCKNSDVRWSAVGILIRQNRFSVLSPLARGLF